MVARNARGKCVSELRNKPPASPSVETGLQSRSLEKAVGHRQSGQPRIYARSQDLVPANLSSIRLQYRRRTHRVVSRQSPTAIYALYAVDSLCRYPALAGRNTRQAIFWMSFQKHLHHTAILWQKSLPRLQKMIPSCSVMP